MGSRSSVRGVINHICHSWPPLVCVSIKGWMFIAKLIGTPSLVKFPPAFWSDNLYLIFKEKFTPLSVSGDRFLCWAWIERSRVRLNSSGMCITEIHLFVEHNKLCTVFTDVPHIVPFVRKWSPTLFPTPSAGEAGLQMWTVLITGDKNSLSIETFCAFFWKAFHLNFWSMWLHKHEFRVTSNCFYKQTDSLGLPGLHSKQFPPDIYLWLLNTEWKCHHYIIICLNYIWANKCDFFS